MTDVNAKIRAAIESEDIQQARQLAREALDAQPDADTYYLAAQVALNRYQEREFLQKAVELNPFHEGANEALREFGVTPAYEPEPPSPEPAPPPAPPARPGTPVASTLATEAESPRFFSAEWITASEVLAWLAALLLLLGSLMTFGEACRGILGECDYEVITLPVPYFGLLALLTVGASLAGYFRRSCLTVAGYLACLLLSLFLGYVVGSSFVRDFEAGPGWYAWMGGNLALFLALLVHGVQMRRRRKQRVEARRTAEAARGTG